MLGQNNSTNVPDMNTHVVYKSKEKKVQLEALCLSGNLVSNIVMIGSYTKPSFFVHGAIRATAHPRSISVET